MTCDFFTKKEKEKEKKRELACFLMTTNNELCCNEWVWVKHNDN